MPLAISLAIAFSTSNLKAEYLHVKNNSALEVAGSIEQVVTGKTNTLTKGDMDIATLHIGNETYFDVDKQLPGQGLELNRALLKTFQHCVLLNTEARMEMADTGEKGAPPVYFPSGSPVEVGLFRYLIREEKDHPIQSILVRRERAHKLRAMIPFSTDRKRMTVAYGLPEEEQGEMVRVVVKGAPEYLVPLCT
jgi:magnesium-transporting ATPase (P-type)